MKCPACTGTLRQKNAGNLVVDICYGGCGGIWFDRSELERVDARGGATLHTVWRDPNAKVIPRNPRTCPKCEGQLLQTREFGQRQRVEIDECPKCGGLWLDEGEFSRVFDEIKGQKVAPPGWTSTIADVVSKFRPPA